LLYYLDISGNKIASINADAFKGTWRLGWLNLANSSIMDIHPSTFRNNSWLDHLDISGNKITSINPDTFNGNWHLKWLNVANNSIMDIHPSTFRNNIWLDHLDISGNKITFLNPHIFNENWNTKWLNLANNNITNVHKETFRSQTNLLYLDISGTKITSLEPLIFQANIKLTWLLLGNNNIAYINPSVFLQGINLTYLDISGNRITAFDSPAFRNQTHLHTLILSDNKLQCLGSRLFTDCWNLRKLCLSGNNISVISDSSFYGLEQLEHLDLSNNNIEVLSPLVFQHMISERYIGGGRSSRLKYLSLAGNKIRHFKLHEYLPFNGNTESACTTFKLLFLNLSLNRLESLDSASVKWLNQSAAGIDLAGNPWRCECAALREAWRELHDKLALLCAFPRHLNGKTWDVIEILCPDMNAYGEFHDDVNHKTQTSATARSLATESAGLEQKENNGVYTSLVMMLLIVNGVILVCALVGAGFILLRYVKELKKHSKASEYSRVYVPPPRVGLSTGTPSDSNSQSGNAAEHVYETIM
jgi:Leucine-rich repeat (LRR) protein